MDRHEEKGLPTPEQDNFSGDTPPERVSDESSARGVVGLTLVTIPTVLTSFLVFLDSAIIVTAIPVITSEFGSITDIGWYSSVYLLCNIQPLLGRFYGHLPLKATFLTFLSLFEIGSLVCALAHSSGMLIAGRALAGVGGAGVLNGSLAIISSSVPLTRRPMFLSIALGVAQLGTAFGPLIGGVLTQDVTWRWNFWLNLPAGGFATAVLLFAPVPPFAESRVQTADCKTKAIFKLDWFGFVLFASSVVMMLIALQWGSDGTRPWNSATVIGLFVGAGLTAVVFGFWEYRQSNSALIPLEIMSHAAVYSGCLMAFFQMGNMVITLYYLPLWFQLIQHKSPILSGVYLLPMIGAQILFAVVSGALMARTGKHALFCLFNGVTVAIGAGLMTAFNVNTSVGSWVGPEILIGAGRGVGIQMPFIAIQAALPASDAAIGTSLAIFSQYFGGAVFSGIAEAMLVSVLTTKLSQIAPFINPKSVVAAGGNNVQASVPPSVLAIVIEAYNYAITRVFLRWLVMATAIALFLAAPGMGWRKIVQKT